MIAHEVVAAARETLRTSPEAFCLPVGLIEQSDADELVALAAVVILWVARREDVSPDAAMHLLRGDYVLGAILHEAAARQGVER